MDYTTLPIAPDEGKILEPVAVASLYEALQQLSDPRRGQGKRYALALLLCLLVARETGRTNEFEWSDGLDSTSCDSFGRAVQPASQEYAMPDDVLQRAGESECEAPGRDPGNIFCALLSRAAVWSATEPFAHAARKG